MVGWVLGLGHDLLSKYTPRKTLLTLLPVYVSSIAWAEALGKDKELLTARQRMPGNAF